MIGSICNFETGSVEYNAYESIARSVLHLGHSTMCTARVWRSTPAHGYEMEIWL